ncbi:tannase/feruloyl esterase family alpha/beta hydrolase [Erythrobacter arachoides]|uniref:Tannase/feruloyl esterase family alpha/beta hydrolase n=1 Tax=Aurantiacibacter arachoides TaxID=1850444 RepID=A0A844ZX48_9SPHN|nr:tannase/feruloyl esterase family alpha/beta hydrolase [Aurantiacibacter arachoides]MXO92034.1 tannase/feruloyl esterase family alpha/beta hydrolase [Aurantiacibacter arachoides]GGD60270.1 hypothetical protein GCM10011411_20560 [Aurantiacibacter arachoides]
MLTIAFLVGMLGQDAGLSGRSAAAPFAARCEALADSAAAMPGTAIANARLVDATADLPRHCLVEGVIDPRTGVGGATYGIRFELRLPEAWNGRYLLQGGGGLNGVVRPATGPVAAGSLPALARGFAVASHDSGHRGEVFDASFYADQRAALDFAEAAVRTVTLATRALTGSFYGAAPHHSYMTGCSTGGREGMLASQRYPELFDGIAIGAPAMRPGHSNLAIEHAQVLLNATQPAGVTEAARFSSGEIAAIDAELTRQCDGADGRVDGMIMNVAACRAFDPAPLACSAGQSGQCLAPDRVEVLQTMFAGQDYYVSIPWDTGITWIGPGLPGYLPAGQPSPFGPANASRAIDISARLHDLQWDAVGRLTDTAYWTNLSTYLGRGGKLIYFHGVSDPWFSAFDTLGYFDRARAANGEANWDAAARFYMVPGMGHCQGGDAYDSFDLLGPLVAWTEGGAPPGAVPASGRPGHEGETMPLCPYPAYAHHDREGLACRAP